MAVIDTSGNLIVPPVDVLKGAPAERFSEVVLIGKDRDGGLYVASSHNINICIETLEDVLQRFDEGEEIDTMEEDFEDDTDVGNISEQ